MPRQPRIDAPGAVHHVWTRGIEKRSIFLDDEDRDDLVARFCRILPESQAGCLAWAFLSNHIHLVVRTGERPLSELMSRVNTGFALRFNRRHDRSGHLFQNRFGSRLISGDRDLLGAVVYVERNPLAAGIVEDVGELSRYRWSGLGALTGEREPHPFERLEETRSLFPEGKATTALTRAIASSAPRDLSQPSELPIPASSPDLPELVARICAAYSVSAEELLAGRRSADVSAARTAVCHVAIRQLGFSSKSVAQALRLTSGAVSQALRRTPDDRKFLSF
ncbi:MAG: transposase [Myxococcota bacterium]